MDVLSHLWLELYTHGGSIQPFFIKNKIKNIAIYGGAAFGALLFNEVKKYGVNVHLCIMDH